MAKIRYIKVEYSILLIVVIAVALLILPFSLENTKQAAFISKWNEIFNKVEYMFSVMNAHIDDDMLKSMKRAETTKEKEQVLLTVVKPYLRINTQNFPSKWYKPKYKNGTKIQSSDRYYFDEFYFAKNKTVVGIKNIKTTNAKEPLFIMMFDVNGTKLPNKWGVDIFGIDIFEGGRIEPFGYDKTLNVLKDDCSENGTGVDCSYYYKIGGEF